MTFPLSMKPIWASSPLARMAVVTSSVPFGAPIGFGGGAPCLRVSGGEAGVTARGLSFGGAGLRLTARAFGAVPLRGAPRRSGRFAGSVPSTDFAAGFAFGPFSAIRSECTPGSGSPGLLSFVDETFPRVTRSGALTGYETGPKLRVEVDNRSA
jgi:hypothetical protein